VNEAAAQRLSGEYKAATEEHVRASNPLEKARFENMSKTSTFSAITRLRVSRDPGMII
jgi:hypothetical protein